MKTSNFSALKAKIVVLLELGLPVVLISQVLTVSLASARNYVNKVIEGSDFKGSVKTPTDSRPTMLMLLARLRKLEINPDLQLYNHNIEEALNWFFEKDRILKSLELILFQFKKLMQPAFKADVPIGYQEFIKDLVKQVQNPGRFELMMPRAHVLWSNFLQRVASGELEFSSQDLKDSDFIINFIMDEISIDFRDKIYHSINGDIVHLIENDLFLSITEREATILKLNYGLGYEKASRKLISDLFGITETRVKQIKEKALRRCAHRSRLKMIGLC